MILGIDVGGTFTDLVLLDSAGCISIHKLLTSARDPSESILRGIAHLQAAPDSSVVHGATVATNALLERTGARTALVTTLGFRDVLEIGRQTRPDLYALCPSRPEPLVPEERRFEVPERIGPVRGPDRSHAAPQATRLLPLDLDAADVVVREILSAGVESVAICTLFSFLDPSHELQLRQRIALLGGARAPLVSLSSEVLPEYREYERTVATVINAYVAPLMDRYLTNLEAGLAGRRLRIMQSNGGSISADAARRLAARTSLSGPAGGVVGAFEVARSAGWPHVITLDMGGTSTDVSLCPGYIQQTTEGSIAGLPFRLPTIGIHTVGAGGGSIASLDEGGALRVGPRSAGAQPGPVCYGHPDAHEVTVTDANLVLGRLDAGHFLGGSMPLHPERARQQVQGLARHLSLPLEAAAWGIIRVANSNMERAIRTISIERGHDPREFTLLAFGGAGPLHACELADALRIPRVLIPPHPGVLSALGMILSDVVKDYSQTVMIPAAGPGLAHVGDTLARLAGQARTELSAEGVGGDVRLAAALDMRYVGQSYELSVPLPEANGLDASPPGRDLWAIALDMSRIQQDFHAAHQRRFSYSSPGEPLEIVNVRLRGTSHTPKPVFARRQLQGLDPSGAHVGYKVVYFSDSDHPNAARPHLAALYERSRLAPGNILVGPAIVFQFDTTTVVPPGWAACVDPWDNLIMERARQ